MEGLIGQKVRLSPADKEKHFENALRWMNDPEVTRWTMMGDMPITRVAEEEFFDRMLKPNDTEILFAIETLDGQHIGFSGIHQIDWRHGVATTGSIIGEKSYWRHGFGSEAARLRTNYAFDVLGLRMLLSSAFSDNTGSLKMLKKAGYVEVGRMPKRYWKRGAYRDMILLVVDRDSRVP